jgi:SAM-dependent methyltransferase
MKIRQIDTEASAILPRLPPATAHLLPRIERKILDGDLMFAGDPVHYLSCGASALNAILAVLQSAQAPAPGAILDFGGGAGRVTRWLRVAFPDAALEVADLPGPNLEFQRAALGTATWDSSIDIASLSPPRSYDLIWAGSVITHLRELDSVALMRKLYSWLTPNGLVIASFHGRFARALGDATPDRYIAAASWRALTAQSEKVGYGFADYDPNSPGYGVSLCTLAWIAALGNQLANARIAFVAERGWDWHQDVVAFQKPG